MTTFIKKLIDQLYQQSNENAYRQVSQKMLSVSVPSEDASMIKAIADYFDQSLSNFCSEILCSSIREAFAHLTPEDRLRIAAIADELTTEHQKKQGISETTNFGDIELFGSYYWQMIADPSEPHKTAAMIKARQESQ
jgi:cell division protein ZapA (FtsZ GTPase activity inhibitor)